MKRKRRWRQVAPRIWSYVCPYHNVRVVNVVRSADPMWTVMMDREVKALAFPSAWRAMRWVHRELCWKTLEELK